jgi:hypothetical protein
VAGFKSIKVLNLCKSKGERSNRYFNHDGAQGRKSDFMKDPSIIHQVNNLMTDARMLLTSIFHNSYLRVTVVGCQAQHWARDLERYRMRDPIGDGHRVHYELQLNNF